MIKIKKYISLLIILVLTQSSANANNFEKEFLKDDKVYKSSATKINYINPTIQDNKTGSIYPGYRGTNQLIIYTPEYGRKTGTNEFGTEAIVTNGYVTSLSGADSLIPHNGFVISGHGVAKDWINKNITLGTKIIINSEYKVLIAAQTSESFLLAANEKIKEVFTIIKYYTNQNIYYDFDTAIEYLAKAQKALMMAIKKEESIPRYSENAIANATKAIEHAIPYNDREIKGVWIRPTQKSKSEIEDTLNRLKDAGINNIFLETFYHAKTIYPSDVLASYNITNQRQEFVGFDPLRIWINEAHLRDMKVHVWFECFYVGNDNPLINPRHILNVYPQWANSTKTKYNSKNPTSSPTEHNGYFLDPANPMVQNFLIDVICEILEKYKPDGINLDYIRYPQTVDKKSLNYVNFNWGYTQFAREEFIKKYNIDPIKIDNKNSMEWVLWSKYRQEKINDFVKKISETVRDKTELTAVIFPDRQKVLDTKMQDWKTWSMNNYIDGFTPLILTCDYETAKALLSDIKNNSSKFTDIYMGLFVSFMHGSTDDFLKQIHLSRELNTKGVIIFENSHFTSPYINAVSASAFKKIRNKNIKKYTDNEKAQKEIKEYLDEAMTTFYENEEKLKAIIYKKNKNNKNDKIKEKDKENSLQKGGLTNKYE